MDIDAKILYILLENCKSTHTHQECYPASRVSFDLPRDSARRVQGFGRERKPSFYYAYSCTVVAFYSFGLFCISVDVSRSRLLSRKVTIPIV